MNFYWNTPSDRLIVASSTVAAERRSTAAANKKPLLTRGIPRKKRCFRLITILSDVAEKRKTIFFFPPDTFIPTLDFVRTIG